MTENRSLACRLCMKSNSLSLISPAEAGHAGILIEAPQAIVPALETFLIGNAQTDVLRIAQMRSATNEQVLQDRLFAKEFLSSFGPGRVSFKHSSSGDLSSKAYARSKSAAT